MKTGVSSWKEIGEAGILDKFLELYGEPQDCIDPDERRRYGEALEVFAEKNCVQKLAELWNYPHDCEHREWAFLRAAQTGALDSIKWIVMEAKFRISQALCNDALERASKNGHKHIIIWMVEEAKFKFFATPFLRAFLRAVHGKHLDLVKWFVQEFGCTLPVDYQQEAIRNAAGNAAMTLYLTEMFPQASLKAQAAPMPLLRPAIKQDPFLPSKQEPTIQEILKIEGVRSRNRPPK